MNPTIDDSAVITAMHTYGGSFVRALALAFYRADSSNFARLRAAFPEYWEEYTKWAEHDRKAQGMPR